MLLIRARLDMPVLDWTTNTSTVVNRYQRSSLAELQSISSPVRLFERAKLGPLQSGRGRSGWT
ncbi:unnamed protein product [Prunus armeniaca]